MNRLFVAIELPGEVKRELKSIRKPFNGLRWQNAENYHLTLKFIGDVDDDRQREIEDTLSDLSGDPFTLTISGLGYFPPNKHPRVIWAGVQEKPALMDLQDEIESSLTTIGIEKEQRSYHPHITLGKNKNVQRHVVENFIQEHEEFEIPGIAVTDFILYSSKLTSGSAIHTPEQKFQLT